MCAIAGLWKKNDKITQTEIERMRDTMVHRGPNGSGLYIDHSNNIGLGHRRLSIIDLSDAGTQPMISNSGKIALVFNGEIYNYHALREQAKFWGYKFKSSTDTEVIIALYEQYGLECLHYLRGMFALALWDVERQQLLLARDRVGIKPLYLYEDGMTFGFASEIRAFQSLSIFDKKIDVSALFDFFSYQYIPAPKSVYSHIRKLMAGHYALFTASTGQLSIIRYWHLPKPCQPDQLSESDVIDQVDELISDAVRSHLVSDVPIGAFLSGGLDSSTIVTMAARHQQSLSTFTVDFDSKNQLNEGNYARELADYLNISRHKILTLKGDQFEYFTERFVEIYDEPFGDTSGIPTYELCGEAAKDVKVILSGDGGDEVFGGYIPNYIPLLKQSHSYFCLSKIAQQFMRLMPTKMGYSILYKQLPLQQKIIESALLLRYGQKKMIFSKDALQAAKINSRIYNDAWQFSYIQEDGCEDYIRKRMEMDILSWLPEKMLTKVDRASMSNSLEVRVPFLDHLIVEFMFKLPSTYQWHPQKGGKWVVREILSRYVPDSVTNRPKQGFSIPLNSWKQQAGEAWFERVRDSRIVRDGVFSWNGIKFADTRSSLVQWMIVNVAAWSDRYSWTL